MADVFAILPVVFLLAIAIPLAVIDHKQHRLPNKYTYPAILIAVVGTLLAAAISANWEAFFIGTATNIGLTALALWAWVRNGLGLGDVKLLIAMNQSLAYFSPWLVLLSLLIAVITATFLGLARIFRKSMSWKDRIAFGPFLIFGYAATSVPAVLVTSPY